MEEYDELIDAYLRNELKGEQKINFEKQILSNNELKDQFSKAYEIQQALRHKDLSSKLQFLEELDASVANKQKKRNGFFLAIILSILIVLGLLFYLQSQKKVVPQTASIKYAALFEVESFDNFILHKTKRTIKQNHLLTPQQKKAYTLYSVQSFLKASPLLEDLWNNNNDTLALYYLGISYLGTGKNDKAKQILSKRELSDFDNPIKK